MCERAMIFGRWIFVERIFDAVGSVWEVEEPPSGGEVESVCVKLFIRNGRDKTK